MGTFGKRSNQRPAPGGELFIKTFKQPRTLVWFLEDDPNQWIDFKQHFDNKAKRGWPCALHEGAVNCLGCEFPVEDPTNEKDPGLRVRERSSRWVFPVLDEKGYVSLYMIGYKLWDQLRELYDEYGTITNRQFAIRRSGEGFNDTQYTATRTDERDRPEIRREIPDEEYISNLLGKQYLEAIDRYGYEAADPDPDAEPEPAQRPGDTASEELAARREAAAKQGRFKQPEGESAPDAKQDEPGDEAQAGLYDGADGRKLSKEAANFNAREAGLGELRDWLDEQKVEYPSRAGRPKLIELVEKTQISF